MYWVIVVSFSRCSGPWTPDNNKRKRQKVEGEESVCSLRKSKRKKKECNLRHPIFGHDRV